MAVSHNAIVTRCARDTMDLRIRPFPFPLIIVIYILNECHYYYRNQIKGNSKSMDYRLPTPHTKHTTYTTHHIHHTPHAPHNTYATHHIHHTPHTYHTPHTHHTHQAHHIAMELGPQEFEPWSSQTNDLIIDACCFIARRSELLG